MSACEPARRRSGGSWREGASEARERALFARRARALPAAPVPSLEAILSAADASPRREPARAPCPGAPTRKPGARVLAGLALVAAACIGGVILVSAPGAGQRRASGGAAELDAAVPATAGWIAGAGAVCKPASEEDDGGATCAAPQASFVLASSDDGLHACFQPQTTAEVWSSSSRALACDREAEMSCP
jgi:hypothetical protein